MKDFIGGMIMLLGMIMGVMWVRGSLPKQKNHFEFWLTLSFTVWFTGFVVLAT